jgi:hypothetical protein
MVFSHWFEEKGSRPNITGLTPWIAHFGTKLWAAKLDVRGTMDDAMSELAAHGDAIMFIARCARVFRLFIAQHRSSMHSSWRFAAASLAARPIPAVSVPI